MSLKSRRDYVHGIFERQTEIALENLARVHLTIGNAIDAVFLCGSDFGTQTSAFCSVPTFRELWLPYYKRICDWIHAETTWKCFKLSCGSVKRFYESFITSRRVRRQRTSWRCSTPCVSSTDGSDAIGGNRGVTHGRSPKTP